MPPPVLFHVAPDGCAVGEILAHRRYGSALRGYGTHTRQVEAPSLGSLVWEMALEAARQAVAPGAVSRLDCLFASETETQARVFRDSHRPGSAIYLVEPWPDAKLYRGNYGLISNDVPAGSFFDFMPSIAVWYWTHPPGDQVEVLVGGPVTVRAVIEPGRR